MPISYRNPNNNVPQQQNDLTALPVPRLPAASLDPFVSTVNRMASAGILNQTFANQAIIRSMRNRKFAETGEVSERMENAPGMIFPSGAQLTDETLEEFNNIAFRQLPQAKDPESIGALIPREHSETGGFLALLENFSRLNYAIAGAVNASINWHKNLLFGEDNDETNVIKEAWRGLAMKDRETFSYVFRNLGWTGEDGFTYYARGTIGFLVDVLTDPLSFTKFGSGVAAAVRAGDKSVRVSTALRGDRVRFAGRVGKQAGLKATPQEALGFIAEDMVDTAIATARRAQSVDDLAPTLVDPVAQQASNVLAKRVAERRAREALRRGDTVAADDMLLKAITAEERLDLVNYATKDVLATFNILGQNRAVQQIDKFMEIADKADDFWKSLFTQMTVDPDIAYEVTQRLLRLENLAMSKDGLRKYLVGADILSSRSIGRAGMGRMLEPGGLSIKVPFKPIEFRLARTQFMDTFKLNLTEAVVKSYRKTKDWSTGLEADVFSKPAKLAFDVMESAAGRVAEVASSMGRLFNVNRKKNPQLDAILRKRDAMRDYTARQAQSIVQKTLTVGGKELDNTMNEVLYDALAEAEDRAMIWMENQSYFDRKLALQDAETKARAANKSPEEIAETLKELERDPTLGYDKQVARDAINADKRLDAYSQEVRQELAEIAEKQDLLFREMYDIAKAHGAEKAFMALYLPTQYANLPEAMKFRSGKLKWNVSATDPYEKVRTLQRSEAIKPESEGGLGLKVQKDLFNLLYQRHLASEFSQIERQVVGQIVDSFGIHPGQINKVLDQEYGPTGIVAQNLLGALRVNDTLAERMWTESEVLSAFPRVQELKDLVETGEFAKAVKWIEDNKDVMSLALVRGKHSLHALFAETMNENVNTLVTALDKISVDHNLLIDQMARDFNLSAKGIDEQAAKYFGTNIDAVPMLAVAYGLAFRRAVNAAAGTRGISVAGGDLISQFLGNTGMEMHVLKDVAQQMGDDATRLFTLHGLIEHYESLDEVQKVAASLAKQFEKKFAAAADAFADGVVGSKLAPEGVGFAQLYAAMMGTYSKTAMWELFEKRIDGARSIQRGDLFTGAQAGILENYDEARAQLDEIAKARGATAEEKADLIQQLNYDAFKMLWQHPIVAETYALYGYTVDTLPKWLLDSPQFLQETIDAVRAYYLTGRKANVQIFTESPYLPGRDKAKTAIRQDLRAKISAGIDNYKIDEEAKTILKRIALMPGVMHTGVQWAPQRGIVALSQTSYRRAFSNVLKELRGAAQAAVPDTALSRMGMKKIAQDLKLAHPVRYSKELSEAEFKLMSVTAARLRKIIEGENLADGQRALEALDRYETALHASVKTPFEIAPVATQMQASGRTMRDAYVELEQAVVELRDAIGPLFGDVRGQKILTQHMFDSMDESIEIMRSSRAMAERINAVRKQFHTWTASNARLLALQMDEVEPVLKELDDLYAELRESGRKLSERQNEMYVIEEISLGEDFSTRLLATDPIHGNFWTMTKDLRDAKGNLSPEAIKTAYEQNLAALQKMVANAKTIAKGRDRYREALEEAVNVGRMQVEQISAIDELSRNAAGYLGSDVIDDIADLTTFKRKDKAIGVPRAQKIVDSLLTLIVADKWMRRGDFNYGSWARAIDDVVTNGSDDKGLQKIWDYFSSMQGKADPNDYKWRKRFVIENLANVYGAGNEALKGKIAIPGTSSYWMAVSPAVNYTDLPAKLDRYMSLQNKIWGDMSNMGKLPTVGELRKLAKELGVDLPKEFGGRIDYLAKRLSKIQDSDLNVESFLQEINETQQQLLVEGTRATRAQAIFDRFANNALISTDETRALFEYAAQLKAHEDAWRDVSERWIDTLMQEAKAAREYADTIGTGITPRKRPTRGVQTMQIDRAQQAQPRWYSKRRARLNAAGAKGHRTRLELWRKIQQIDPLNTKWWMQNRAATRPMDPVAAKLRREALEQEAKNYEEFAEYLNGLHVVQQEVFGRTFRTTVGYEKWATDPAATQRMLDTIFPEGLLDDIDLGVDKLVVPDVQDVAKNTVTSEEIAGKLGLSDKAFGDTMGELRKAGLTPIGPQTPWRAEYRELLRRYEAEIGFVDPIGGERYVEFDSEWQWGDANDMLVFEKEKDFQTWLESKPAADETDGLLQIRADAKELNRKLEGKPLATESDLDRDFMERIYVAANTTQATIPNAPEFMRRFIGDLTEMNHAASARKRDAAASWFAREAKTADLLALRQAGARHFFSGADYDPAVDDLLNFINTHDPKFRTQRVEFWARVFGLWDYGKRPLTKKQLMAIKAGKITKEQARQGLLKAQNKTAFVEIGSQTLLRLVKQGRNYSRRFGKQNSRRYTAMNSAVSQITNAISPQAQKLTAQLEAAVIAEAKLPMLQEAVKRAKAARSTVDQLGPDATPNVRAMRSMINYMQFRNLQQQSVAFSKLLAMMPHPDDQAFIRVLAARQAEFGVTGRMVGEQLDEVRLQGAQAGAMDPEKYADLAEQATAYELAVSKWDEILDTSSQAYLTRLNIDLNSVADEEMFKAALRANGITFDARANMWVRGLATDPVVSSVDVMDLNSMINDVMSYFRTVDRGLKNAPILEAQAYTLTRILRGAAKDPGNQQIMLYAVTGMTDVSSLTALQAAHAISFLGSKTNTQLTELGLKAVTDANYDHVKRVAAVQGRLPKAATVEARPEDFVAPPGSPHELVYRQFSGMEGALSDDGIDLGAGFYIERHLADAIQDAMIRDEAVTGPIREMLARAIDPITNSFKYAATAIHPAFVVRNIVDGFVRSMLALGIKGFNVKRNYDMYKIMSAQNLQAGQRSITIKGQKYDALFLRDMFERHGGGVTFEEKLGIVRVGVNGITDPRLHPFADNFIFKGVNKVKNVVDNINGSGDNMFRLNIFVDGLEQGMEAADAITRMHKVMFDYQYALSPFERDVMRRIFPFYTFSRFNIPLSLEVAFKHPGYFAALHKANMTVRTGEGEEYERLMPSYIKDNWMFSPRVQGNELHVTTGRNIFAVEDLGFLGDMIRSGNIRDGVFDEIFSRMNPLYKLPIEFAVGKNLYFKNDIVTDAQLTAEFLDLPGLSGWLDVRPVIINGEQHYRVNGRNWHLLMQSHFARTYRSLASVVGTNRKGSFMDGVVALMTGLRHQVIELDRRLMHVEGMAAYNAREITDALKVGDVIKLKRLTGILERDEEQQVDTVAALVALREQVQRAKTEEARR